MIETGAVKALSEFFYRFAQFQGIGGALHEFEFRLDGLGAGCRAFFIGFA